MSAASPAAVLVPRKRRGAELFLLILALVVGVGAYVAVGLGFNGEVPSDTYTLGGGMTALAIIAHITVRRFAPYADPVLLPLIVALNGLGLAMIHRIDLGLEAEDSPFGPFASNQLLWTLIGVLAFVGVLVVVRDHRRLQAFTYTFGLLALGLLLLPLVPGLGATINGARIWIQVGPLSFQPGEVAKLCLVVFFAGYLVVKRDALALAGRRFLGIDLPRGRDLGPILVAWLLSLGVLVFQRDLGSSLLFFGLFLVLLYVATERPGWLVVGGMLFAAGAYFSYLTFGHVQDRIHGWTDTFEMYESGQFEGTYKNAQVVDGLFGMGYGGLIGRGLGQGDPTETSYSWSDFITASLGEELGLAGLMAILMIYALLVERGLRTALQVFVVVGGVTRLIPLTGLTAPFLSYGGSSLVVNWAIVAVLLRISDHARRPAPEVRPLAQDDATQVVKLR
jgi:cell division protein FtsW (lipid II flippase)